MRLFRISALAAMLFGAAIALAQAADTGKVVFGHGPTTAALQTAHVVIALEKGFFKEEGLEVEIVRFPSGRSGLEAVLGGQVDLAFMSEYPPVIAALQKQKFAVVTELAKYTANRIISRSDAGFTTFKDLAGKRLGTTIGSNAEFFTYVVLEKAGVKAEIVNLAPADLVPALYRGDIDAAAPFPDYYDKAKALLGARYREAISKDYIAYMIIAASRAMIDTRPGDLKKFLAALIKADKIIQTDPAAAKALVVKGSEGAFDAKAVDAVWGDYTYRLGFETNLLDTLYDEAKWVEGKGMIKGASIDRAGMRTFLADGPITALDSHLSELPK
jgi:NitT/TauT family transport system substrate-binding protein